MYIGWYGLGRVFIEGLRTDSLYVAGTNLRISQLVAGLCVIFAVVFLFYNSVFRNHEPEDLYVNRVQTEDPAGSFNAAETDEKTSEQTASKTSEDPEDTGTVIQGNDI